MDHDELAYRITVENEHPVMRYVRELPVESAVYPANMYHGYSEDDRDEDDHSGEGLITWSLPAHNLERPKRKGCGFIRRKGSGEEGIRYTACSGDADHYIRGRKSHCWSLGCPVCCNDTALRFGTRVEEQLGSYRVLKEKRGEDPGPLGHWIVSPDQEYAKISMQNISSFTAMRTRVEEQLQDCGAKAGCLVFHPWRQGEDTWNLSPHFHSILFGFLDTDRFREQNPGWVIKKVHASEGVESITQTAAYLATHMGLGLVERDVSEVDYDMRFLAYMLPGLEDGASSTSKAGQAKKGRMFKYTEQDISDRAVGKGRMVGDIDGIDWIEFARKPLSYAIRATYFGLASQRSIRTVATEREIRVRVCRVCGSDLNVHDGLCDLHGEHATYTYDNAIRAFGCDCPHVRNAIDVLKEEPEWKGTTLADIAPRTSLIVSRDEVIATGGRPLYKPKGTDSDCDMEC